MFAKKIIIEKAYLIVEEQMPHCLLDFVTHVVGYKAVHPSGPEGDYSERRSTIGWPLSSTPTSNAPTPPQSPADPPAAWLALETLAPVGSWQAELRQGSDQ